MSKYEAGKGDKRTERYKWTQYKYNMNFFLKVKVKSKSESKLCE